MEREYLDPYYAPEKLGLEMLAVEQPDLSYEFNILAFWSNGIGQVWSCSDSGCSCPSPFEDYRGYTQQEVVQKFERIGSVGQAAAIFDSWNSWETSYHGNHLPQSRKDEVMAWVQAQLKKTPPPVQYSLGGRLILPDVGNFGWEPPRPLWNRGDVVTLDFPGEPSQTKRYRIAAVAPDNGLTADRVDLCEENDVEAFNAKRGVGMPVLYLRKA